MNALARHGLLAAALAGGLIALWLHLSTLLSGDKPQTPTRRPDLYIDRPEWRSFGEQGDLQRRLSAAKLEKWPSERRTRLLEPHLELVDAGREPWQADARRGWLDDERRQLTLQQQVRLQRGSLVVTTEALQIGERGGLIETDRPVVLESGNWHFTAIGLRAELGRQQLQLLENVRGIHE